MSDIAKSIVEKNMKAEGYKLVDANKKLISIIAKSMSEYVAKCEVTVSGGSSSGTYKVVAK
jgi:hypothetical protein